MPEELKNIGEEYQRLRKDGFDAAVRSFGEMNRGLQSLSRRGDRLLEKAFEDVFRAWEEFLGARSVGQVFEIQSQFAKKAYDNYMSEVSKLGEMYLAIARNASKPVEKATARRPT
jgi:hypothetical protein